EGEHLGRIDGIVVEALAALPAVHAGQHHALEERRRGVALLAVLGEHDLGDLVGRIQPDEVEEGERPHGIAAAELHRLVDVRHGPHAALDRPDRVEQVGDEQEIDDEAGVVLRRHWLSAEVVTVRTTSTSGISGTGLKKCKPTKRSPRFVAAAIAAIVRLDVFEAKMVAGPHRSSSSFHRAFLSSRSSVTASTTTSHGFRSAVAVVKCKRLRVASRSEAGSFPFSTNLASDFSIPARALSQTCWDTSRTVVSNPAAAATWAIPLPMSPEPSTPTRLMS